MPNASKQTKAHEVSPVVKGIRVDVPSEMSRSDFNELLAHCVPFEDGLRCHMGIGETRVFLVHPSHVVEANEILKRYDVKIVKTLETGSPQS